MGGYPPLRNTTGSVPPVSVRTSIFQVTQSEASQLCRSSRHDWVPVLPPCAIGFSNFLFFRYSEPRLLIRAETASPEIAPESMLRLRPIDCNLRFLKLARMTVRDPGREPRGHRARSCARYCLANLAARDLDVVSYCCHIFTRSYIWRGLQG